MCTYKCLLQEDEIKKWVLVDSAKILDIILDIPHIVLFISYFMSSHEL
jgi:hypothetical protein